MPARLAAWLLSVTCLATFLPAQRPFAELPLRHLPEDPQRTLVAAAADVDGDGVLDLVLGRTGPNVVLRGDGHGVFETPVPNAIPAIPDATFVVVAFDADGDGDPDLFEGNRGVDRLHLNQGNGTFVEVTATHLPLALFETLDALAVDVDGDLDLDLVLAVQLGPSSLYLNDGSGRFTDATAGRLPGPANDLAQAVVAADFDGDLDLDLVFVAPGARPRLLLNDGAGRFTDASSTRFPAGDVDGFACVAFDADRDGDVDLWIGIAADRDLLWRNDGTGHFTPAPAGHVPPGTTATLDLAAADLDGDGDVDVVRATAEGLELLRNDGTGVFARQATLPRLPGRIHAVLAQDLDGDADVDLFAARDALRDALLLNDGRGGFALATAPPLPEDGVPVLAVAVGDVDSDGVPDLIAGRDGEDALFLGDGTGAFEAAAGAALPAVDSVTTAVALGDVDGDLDLDLVVGDHGGSDRLLLNSGGTLRAPASGWPSDQAFTRAVLLTDLDGDSDLDVVLAGFGQDRFYRNTGQGRFTDVTATDWPPAPGLTNALAAGDVDRDGHVDVVLARSGANALHRGTASGGFVAATVGRFPADTDDTRAVVLVDVDRDQDLDIVFGNALGRDRLLLNDGTGHFTDASGRLPASAASNATTRALAVLDFDGDGAADLLVGRERTLELWRNDGTGRFAELTAALPAPGGPVAGFAVADLDGDGDPDVVVASDDGRTVRLVALRRQLALPHLARPGRVWTLEIHAEPGASTAVQATPFVSALRLPAPLALPPIGDLWLDPLTLVPLPTLTVPAPAGTARLAIPMPASAALVGARLFAQALVQHPPAPLGWRLTGFVEAVVLGH